MLIRKRIFSHADMSCDDTVRNIALRRAVFAYYDNKVTHNYEDSEKGIRKLVYNNIKDLKLTRQEKHEIYSQFMRARADMNKKDVGIKFGNTYLKAFKTFHNYQTNRT